LLRLRLRPPFSISESTPCAKQDLRVWSTVRCSGSTEIEIQNNRSPSCVYIIALVVLPDGSVAVSIVVRHRTPVDALVVEFPGGLVE
jgi:hypothetical protein